MPTTIPLGKAIKAMLGASAVTGGIGYGKGRQHGRKAEHKDIQKSLEPMKGLLAKGDGKAKSKVKTAAYIHMVTPEERAASIKFGAMLGFHANGVLLDEVDEVVKQALPSGSGMLDSGMKAIVYTSLIGGIPLGVAAHLIGRSVSANRKAERERLARIKYYRDVTGNLESGLTGVPRQDVVQ